MVVKAGYNANGRKKATIYNHNVSSEDVAKYVPAVNSVIIRYILRCFRGTYIREEHLECSLGNSGWTIRDVQSYLLLETFIALTHFNPTHITPEQRSVKESTFVIGHLHKRAAVVAERLTRDKYGYGVKISSIESPDEGEVGTFTIKGI